MSIANVNAVIGPMPGAVASSLLTGLALCAATQFLVDLLDRDVELLDLLTQKNEYFFGLGRNGGLLFNSRE